MSGNWKQNYDFLSMGHVVSYVATVSQSTESFVHLQNICSTISCPVSILQIKAVKSHSSHLYPACARMVLPSNIARTSSCAYTPPTAAKRLQSFASGRRVRRIVTRWPRKIQTKCPKERKKEGGD
jgi:hypothetical protein